MTGSRRRGVRAGMRAARWSALLICVLGVPGAAAEPAEVQETVVFRAGESGYHTFRIPSLAVTRRGVLLAFAEGRKNSRSDTGDIDLVLKRSLDGGKTFEPLQVVADHGRNTIGNPCHVVDRDTGVIWLMLTGNAGDVTEKQILEGEGTRTVWVTRSADEGKTWSPAFEITSQVRRDGWTWYATGPGNGIQLRSGELVIPACHAVREGRTYASHAVISRDHGKSWHAGGSAGTNTDEATVVELEDRSLMLNMRMEPATGKRGIARRRYKGRTWSAVTYDEPLIDPGCEASLIRLKGSRSRRAAMVFSNPASTKRIRETVRLSMDGGRSWPYSRVLHEGPSAYSSLAELGAGAIACLFERGERGPYEEIVAARFTLGWLKQGLRQ